MTWTIYLAEIWHIVEDDRSPTHVALQTFSHGAMVVNSEGNIEALGEASQLLKNYRQANRVDLTGKIILPGFIDLHLHMPQLDIVGSYGESLLGWLEKYTFPHELKCKDSDYAQASSKRLFQLLLAHGTTTSVIFATTFKTSAEHCFQTALDMGCRAIIGKVAMDRNAPADLCQSVKDHISEEQSLIKKWHGYNKQLYYALTPRFAPSTTEDMLDALAELHKNNPSLYIQTHLAENPDEVLWVKKLFPKAPHYLGVYAKHGLLNEHSIFAHGIHLSPEEMALIKEHNGKIAHCPTSNAFLGSGFFSLPKIKQAGIAFGLGTDIGGGTSFSMWQTMLMCYQLQKLMGHSLSPSYLLYLSSLAGAQCLGLDDRLGNFSPGKHADFQVVDYKEGNPLLSQSTFSELSPEERLFRLITLGDDRITRQVYVAGKQILNKEIA